MHTVTDTLLREWPIERWANNPQLLAVSGGADSVALLRAMVELSPNRHLIVVAHFNHNWRGTESDDDEAFVRDLCKVMGLHLEVGSSREQIRTASDNNFRSVPNPRNTVLENSACKKSEESARKLRYQFLNRIASKLGVELVLTAHTASDRIETMLHNLCRGTGLAGLCSPTLLRKMRSGITLVRPFIGCFRSQIEDYLSELNQPYRNDSSNNDLAFRRNYLRANVLPLMQEVYGKNLEQRMLAFSQIVEETLHSQCLLADDYLKTASALSRDSKNIVRLASGDQQTIVLPDHSLLPAPWPIVRTAISEMWDRNGWPQQSLARRHWEQIRTYWCSSASEESLIKTDHLQQTSKPAITLPGSIRLQSQGQWIVLKAILGTPK